MKDSTLQDVAKNILRLANFHRHFFKGDKTMKLNIYKNQKEIEKTYEVDEYDIMYGTVQDILEVLDEGIADMNNNDQLVKVISANKSKLEDLLMDIFGAEGLTKEELRRTKLKELVPVFIDLFRYVTKSFKSKN